MQSFERDIHVLIDTFVHEVLTKGKKPSFETFKELWASFNFSFIHYAAPIQSHGHPSAYRQSNAHLQLLYTTALHRLSYPSPCKSIVAIRHRRHFCSPAGVSPSHPGIAVDTSTAFGANSDVPLLDEPQTKRCKPSHPTLDSDKSTSNLPQSVTGAAEQAPVASANVDVPAQQQATELREHKASSVARERLCGATLAGEMHAADVGVQHPHSDVNAGTSAQLFASCGDGPSTDAARPTQSSQLAVSCGHHADNHVLETMGDQHDGMQTRALPEPPPKTSLLRSLNSHPFLRPLINRRRRPPPLQPQRQPKQRVQLRAAAQDVVDLREMVVPEAQVGAIFCLFLLYGTQPSRPKTHIYLPPQRLTSLHGVLKMLQQCGAQDGVRVLQQLVAEKAFVFGAIEVRKKHQSLTLDESGVGQIGSTFTSRQQSVPGALHSSILEDALRRSMIHLWQAAPQSKMLHAAHAEYQQAVADLFQGVHNGPAQASMSLLSPQLPNVIQQYCADMLQDIRHALTPISRAEAKRRKEAHKLGHNAKKGVPRAAAIQQDDLDAELLAEGVDIGDALELQNPVGGHPDNGWLAGLGNSAAANAVRLDEQRARARSELQRCWLPYAQGGST